MILIRFLSRRIAESVLLLLGLMTAVFFLARLLPGDATSAFLSPTISPEVLGQIKEQFGLDRSLAEQYGQWIVSLLTGNLGYSFTRNVPVTEIIGAALPNTVLLGIAALSIEVGAGILIAATFFFFAGRKPEAILSQATLVVYSLPPFWVGMLLLLAFAYGLGVLPSSHMYDSGREGGSVLDIARHLVLPALTVAIPAAAGFARYLHGSVRHVLQQEFFVSASSIGLTRRALFRNVVLPNVLSPVVSLLGVELGILLGGVLVTEYLFSWPGMGRLTVAAIGARDYPLVMGCTFVAGLAVIGGNLIADIINALRDPRIRETHERQ